MSYDYGKLVEVAYELELLAWCPYEKPGYFSEENVDLPRLKRLEDRGLMEREGVMWRCTAKGMEILDTLMSKQIIKIEDLAEKMLPRRIKVANDNRKK
jgi:hypothetical protein